MNTRKANKGSFKKGNPGGPGRPRRETEREYLEATLGVVSLADWKAVVRKALKDAKAGDHRAREFLAKHLLPKDAGDIFDALLKAIG